MLKSINFITSIAGLYFTNDNGKLSIDENDEILAAFISDPQNLTLCIFQEDGNVKFNSEFNSTESGISIVFYKNKAITLENDDSLHHLGLSILPSNPMESFYLSLRHIFGPIIQSDNTLSMEPKLQEMVSNLEASLRTIAHGKDGGPSLLVVFRVDDELQYWKAIASESKTNRQRDMAESFVSILETLTQEMSSIESVEPNEIRDAMENAGGLLDDLWRHSTYIYPQKRMTHLLDIIGNACILRLQDILNQINVWGNDSNIMNTISDCNDVISNWIQTCTSLTKKYWPNHSLHIWEGSPYESEYVKTFNKRLSDVIEIREMHFQLTKLLSTSEQDELALSQIFTPFKDINIWRCTHKNNLIWTKSKSKFDIKLKPAEDKIAQKLKSRLKSSSAHQVLYEFNKYSTLIERPYLYDELQKERQLLMGTFRQLLKEIENQIGKEKSIIEDEFIIPEISPLIQQIQWTKRTEGKIIQIEKTIEKLLKDFEGSTDLLQHTNEVKRSVQNLQTVLFEDWSRELQVELNNKSLMLSADTPVVVFSGENNLMRVTFNPRLITIERDVRHLGALGLHVSANIKEAVNYSAKFMQHAKTLQQVASFHNTQSERMIVSQRPMMLNAAIQLASLVKEQTVVSWKDIESVSKYVDKLKSAVDNLVKQNSFLTSQHIIMRNIVLSLMDTNLLQKQTEWKKSLRQMNDIIASVETQGYTNIKTWITHWNIQLYKALEHQYRNILINPLNQLPIARIELIFRQQGIQLQPPLEEIRASCHVHLKKLISLPLHFYGIQKDFNEQESMFASIVSRNSWLAAGAMNDIETTLEKVIEAVRKWKKLAALGSVDIDSLCDIHLSHPSDWDRNFKECKAFGQTIAKLPMEDEKIDWICLSSATLRNDLEAHNRRYWISLTTSLQSNVQRDIVTLEAYSMSVHSTIGQNIPKTAKELATFNEEFNKLKEKESQMASLFEEVRQKQTMVRAWGGERVQSLDALSKKWDNLTSLLQNHEKLLSHQAESVKGNLVIEWSNLLANTEVWYSRWSQNKPKIDQLTNIPLTELQMKYNLFNDALDVWEKHTAESNAIIVESEKFNLKLEEHSSWNKIEKSVLDDINFWEPFKKFTEELSALGSQEWIFFQKNLNLLEEFILEWSKKLEPFTVITLFIQKEIDQYKEIIPSLKYLRSNNYTERHWREIYSLLDIPIKSSDTLTLIVFLNVSQNVKKSSKELQKIWQEASHEAIIKEAVAELELWLAGAKLIVINHQDNSGHCVPIIKDFNDVLIKVEEYQNLAASARASSNLKNGTGSNDQLSIWETRLSLIKNNLSSLAHIQRRAKVSHGRRRMGA